MAKRTHCKAMKGREGRRRKGGAGGSSGGGGDGGGIGYKEGVNNEENDAAYCG